MLRTHPTTPWLGALGLHALIVLALQASASPPVTPPRPRITQVIALAPASAPAPAAPVPAPATRPPTPARQQTVRPRPHPDKPVKPGMLPLTQGQHATATDAEPTPAATTGPTASERGHEPDLARDTPPSFSAAYLSNPEPAYPSASLELGESGSVLLRVAVDADGRPISVDIARSSGYGRLDRAALSAVRHWRFSPARRGSEAIAGVVLVPIHFQIRQQG